MKDMTAGELRKKYSDFFVSKGHKIIPSASLIPENDPSVLFTTAGMHPLVPYLLGEKHPAGKKITNAQKCVRTGDIEEVGDATHHTFFEMLGNWSLGDYFKKEALTWSYEFLTASKWLGLDKKRLAVSVFSGDADAPFDAEAFAIWKNLGMDEKKIARLSKKNNWWGMERGPCGPDSEIFYWVGDPEEIPESFNDDNEKWVEIWNNVFMEYNKVSDNRYDPLAQKNVDTGMGLERILSIVNGFDDNYQTELFWPIIEKIEALSGKKYADNKKSFRIVADHLKSATMIVGDEKSIVPSNVDQGYVVRKLVRRAIRHGKILGIENNFAAELASVVIEIYAETYWELKKNEDFIRFEIEKEENKFRKTLENGIKYFNTVFEFGKKFKDYDDKKEPDKNHIIKLSGNIAFNLYQTYGFPIELTVELAREKGFAVDIEEYDKELKKHQDLSRTASAGKFKGGLADSNEKTVQLHTTAHLMLAGLREILGKHIHQKGSNITAERLRFDFSHPEKMTEEQKRAVENYVNEAIAKKIPVEMKEIDLEQAKAEGAEGVFENKYGDSVKVYEISGFSHEICGGPHVKNTGEIQGTFKIKKEESSGAGTRRIKAILE